MKSYSPSRTADQRLLQPGLTGELADQLDLRARQIDRGRDRVQPLHRRLHDGVRDRRLGHDDVVHRDLAGLVADPHARGRVALGIQIHHQDTEPEVGE